MLQSSLLFGLMITLAHFQGIHVDVLIFASQISISFDWVHSHLGDWGLGLNRFENAHRCDVIHFKKFIQRGTESPLAIIATKCDLGHFRGMISKFNVWLGLPLIVHACEKTTNG